MSRVAKMKKVLICFVLCVLCCALTGVAWGDDLEPTTVEEEMKLEEKAREQEKGQISKKMPVITDEQIAQLTFPKDTSPVMTVKQLQITGNTLISSEEIMSRIPVVFNASAAPLMKAESKYLYDFRELRKVIDMPGQPRQISARTIKGLTQCILSIYRSKGYAGIYVEALVEEGKKLPNDTLTIKVTEAPVTEVTTKFFTPDNVPVEEGYLKKSSVLKWSPIQPGQVGNEKELNDFINLLNLNPDRYISAVVSKGPQKDTLALGYNIYEANPWHWFWQIDNAGTKDRQWAPRLGLINTNLLGIDDTLTIFHQSNWDSTFDENYSVYGSYDFPVAGPDWRLNVFGSYSEFDVEGGAGINFLGNGHVYGAELRYNLYQENGWFFDLTTSLSHEKSKIRSTSSLINLASIGVGEVQMDLWGLGFNMHRRDDMSTSSVSLDRVQSVSASKQKYFWDEDVPPAVATGIRTNSERDFTIYSASASHSQFLDTDKVQRVTGSFDWIIPEERLVPAKMTVFGGMYSVRGYEESGVVADGGILASLQYEYDLVKYDEAKRRSQGEDIEKEEKSWLRKLSPLAFVDYGRAKIKDAVPGEKSSENLLSIGMGLLLDIGDNFSGAVYCGYPLKTTTTTDKGNSRVHASLMLRW